MRCRLLPLTLRLVLLHSLLALLHPLLALLLRLLVTPVADTAKEDPAAAASDVSTFNPVLWRNLIVHRNLPLPRCM
jgi:hypothetical protein